MRSETFVFFARPLLLLLPAHYYYFCPPTTATFCSLSLFGFKLYYVIWWPSIKGGVFDQGFAYCILSFRRFCYSAAMMGVVPILRTLLLYVNKSSVDIEHGVYSSLLLERLSTYVLSIRLHDTLRQKLFVLCTHIWIEDE